MEDKIEVGEYVRTKKGIAKVTNIDDLDNVAWTDKKGIYFGVIRESGYLDWYIYDDGTVLKHSKNIIKLIEQGDYVNGYKVLEIRKHFEVQPYRISVLIYKIKDAEFWRSIEEQKIEDIVTHEQFDSIKYDVN